MKYNFDHSPSCKGTWSIKWDQYGDEDIIASVSYTHLDVYKRQAASCIYGIRIGILYTRKRR